MSHFILETAALSLQLETHNIPKHHEIPLGFWF